MGGDWRMPTQAEIQELYNNTDHTWVTNYNGTFVKGRKFTSKSDTSKYIFIPAAGSGYFNSVTGVGNGGGVWGSSLITSDPTGAWGLYFDSNNCYTGNYNRYLGLPVRGVRK